MNKDDKIYGVVLIVLIAALCIFTLVCGINLAIVEPRMPINHNDYSMQGR